MSKLPQPVIDAALNVTDDPQLIEKLSGQWITWCSIIEKDREQGQKSLIGTFKDLRKTAESLKSAVEIFADNDAHLSIAHAFKFNQDDKTFSGFNSDIEAIKRIIATLEFTVSDSENTSKKAPLWAMRYLAHIIIKFYSELGLPRPALSENSPAVKLMMAMCSNAEPFKKPAGVDACRKALGTALKEQEQATD